MPCRDDYYDELSRRQKEKRLHDVTRFLCLVMGQLENAGIHKDYGSGEVHKWWEEHKEADRKREELERKEKERQVANIEKQIYNLNKELKRLK